MAKNLYVLISTKNSRHYTSRAIESFLKYTRLENSDEFYVIDNDGEGDYNYGVDVVINETAKSFSKNVNDIIARANGRDIFVLSNDVIFTPNWSEPLKQYSNVILLPSCNQTHLYTSRDRLLTLKPSMSLDEISNDQSLMDCVNQHKSLRMSSFFERLVMGFYVFRLPATIYNIVGLFDEQFGLGGGEDVDYRLRTLFAGFQVKYHSQSYLLHFGGKSTWDGPEHKKETEERNQQYTETFSNKWGEDLTNFCLVGGVPEPVIKKHNLENLIVNQEFNLAIKALLNIKQRNINENSILD